MDRKLELRVADELLAILADRTVEMTDQVHEEPVESFTDVGIWTLERERLFQRGPVVAAISAELPDPGCWKLFDEVGVPLLLIRGEDGVVRGFLNVCAHRGARLVEEPRGQGHRLTCPFHGWSYSADGALGAVPHPKTFAGICLEDRALRPVEVTEHLGMVWVVAKPSDTPLDVDAFLGPLADELATWDIGSWHHVETRVHQIPAIWKIVTDTFTEGYHIPFLHKDSIGPLIAGGLNAYEVFGDHHRKVFAMRSLEELRDRPREQWNAFADQHMIFTYDIYPNTIVQLGGDHVETYQIFPGESVGSSVCLHSFFTFEEVADEEERAQLSAQFDFFFNLVSSEDFRGAAGIQRGVATGAYPTHLYGRMEPGAQAWQSAFRRDVDRYRETLLAAQPSTPSLVRSAPTVCRNG